MSEPTTKTGKFFKGLAYGIITFAILFGFGSCVNVLIDDSHKLSDERAVRAENGGALPGIEAVDQDGHTYDVDRITFEGANYLCFQRHHRSMGCMKE